MKARGRVLALVTIGLLPLASAAWGTPISPSPAITDLTASPTFLLANQDGGINAGWAFAVNAPLFVKALGFWDFTLFNPTTNATEFVGIGSHTIGIFNDSGTLLTSAVVPAGTAGTLIDGFYYTALETGFFLTQGNYVIGADSAAAFGDNMIVGQASFVASPLITYLGGKECCYLSDGSLSFPDISTGSGVFGPNMLITAAVSEPTTLTLLGAGLLVLCVRRRTLSWR